MKYSELLGEISQGEIANAYLFSGEEDFLKEEALRRLTSSVIEPSFKSFDVDILYGDATEFQTLKMRAETPPLGSKRRVVVLRNTEGLPEGARKSLLGYLDSPSPKSCLVFIAPKVDLKRGFFKNLAAKTQSIVFWRLFDSEITKWVSKYLKEKQLSIDEEALYLLQSSVGNDLFSLANELDKLSIYVGRGKRIGVEEVRRVVGKTRVDSVFDLNRALGFGELGKALKVVHNLINWGERPTRIIATVSHHFFTLKNLKRLVEEGEPLEGKINAPKRYLREWLEQVKRLSLEDIERGLRMVYLAEGSLKAGLSSHRLLLEIMVISICQPQLGAESLLVS